jgi:hypothetical protein
MRPYIKIVGFSILASMAWSILCIFLLDWFSRTGAFTFDTREIYDEHGAQAMYAAFLLHDSIAYLFSSLVVVTLLFLSIRQHFIKSALMSTALIVIYSLWFSVPALSYIGWPAHTTIYHSIGLALQAIIFLVVAFAFHFSSSQMRRSQT